MAKMLELTGEDRILLYMLNFRGTDNEYECDPGITQRGISVNARIQRKHISRYLDGLMEDGCLDEQVRHVRGAKQKMKCYALTPQGLARARELEEAVGNVIVRVRVGTGTREMRIAEVDGATSAHLRLCDIVCEALDNEILDMAVLESIEESNRRMMDERTMRSDVYRRALAAAWRSGILTSSEKHLVDALRSHLGISEDDHRAMEEIARNCTPEPMEVRADLQDEILNLLAGRPPELVQEILVMVRKRLREA